LSSNSTFTREALEQAVLNDELLLYYQPKVCLIKGEVIGAEALVRWPDGKQGVVSPGEFLPLAESTGLLHDLTLKLLDQIVDAFRQLRQSTQALETGAGKRALSLSINVAPDDLASRTISNRIKELLDANTISSGDLQIEITESAVMGNVDRVYDDLCRLKEMDIKILMDDFGTGYSSIDRLSQLPFDALKLDQGVVKRMGSSARNLDVVRSAISMAREMGMTAVAEGVESAEVYNFLIAQGCQEAQGFFIGRPMSLSAFQAFLNEGHQFEGSQIGSVHQAGLNLMRFRKLLIDAAFCSGVGGANSLDSVANPELDLDVRRSRLGLWYFGIGQRLSLFKEFSDIEQPLIDVYETGQRFLKQISKGQGMLQMNQSLAEIDTKIGHLTALLHRLEHLLLNNGHDIEKKSI